MRRELEMGMKVSTGLASTVKHASFMFRLCMTIT